MDREASILHAVESRTTLEHFSDDAIVFSSSRNVEKHVRSPFIGLSFVAVSYTHLTLPTKRVV